MSGNDSSSRSVAACKQSMSGNDSSIRGVAACKQSMSGNDSSSRGVAAHILHSNAGLDIQYHFIV